MNSSDSQAQLIHEGILRGYAPEPGQVCEIRVLGVRNGQYRPGTMAGWFDTEHLNVAALLLAGIIADGSYLTINPVRRDLLARAFNRLITAPKSLTSDGDIERRRKLVLDFDAVRVSGVSATDAEKALALARAQECAAFLQSLGWPQPWITDSGNGGHVIENINLPNDEPSRDLIKKVLKGLSLRYSDDQVKLDETLFNAARILKIPETWARKGDDTPERPHRRAKVLSTPVTPGVVTLDQLETIAQQVPEADTTESSKRGKKQRFDLASWLTRYNLPVRGPLPWSDGHKWLVEHGTNCLFEGAHDGDGNVIVQFSNGAIAARCLHESCAGKDWRWLRKKYESGSGDPSSAHPEPEFREGDSWPYFEINGGLIRQSKVHKNNSDAVVDIPLTNFTARIVANVTRDDGAETSQHFDLELRQGAREVCKLVAADKYSTMRWPIEALGSRAIVYAGQGTSDHARAAIQMLSPSPTLRTVFTHTGWRQIGGEWVYLHGGGAIGANGAVGAIEVDLPPELSHFKLAPPATPADRHRALEASLAILELGPDTITIPVYGAIWRAILGEADFSEYLWGPTGTFKTALGTLVQQHFGRDFTAEHPPASFISTTNTNEALAFIAKDAILLIDEFAPPAGGEGRDRMIRDAVRLFRAQGNRSGRGRMRADTTLRPVKPPRGLILATGEDDFPGESLAARVPTIEVAPGDIDAIKLTACQADAADGLYAQASAAFIQYVASDLPGVRAEFAKLGNQSRVAISGGHRRTIDIEAQLRGAYAILVQFLMKTGIRSEAETTDLTERVSRALTTTREAQAEILQAAEPTTTFFRLLSAALSAGRAHIAATNGECPRNHETACGWRIYPDGSWLPQGDRIGWIEGGDLYLNRVTAYRAAQGMAGGGNRGIEVSARTLTRRLYEKDLLVTTEKSHDTLTVRATIDGQRQENLLHLQAGKLFEWAV